MAVLSGAQFKMSNAGPWFKWLRSDMTHHRFTYSPGLNVDPIKFNPKGNCEPGGLYLIKSITYLHEFYEYGPILGIFDIPDDAQVYTEDYNKFKCDKVVLLETVSSETDLIEYFKKAYENGSYLDSRVCAEAALNGHLEVLKWARDFGCPWDCDTCANAALNGHLEVLKWARDNGCPWDRTTCAGAALNGHLEVLEWAVKNGCPWDVRTCDNAAKNGHLEVLKWAMANGCPWDYQVYQYASKYGHLEALKLNTDWLKKCRF